MGDFAVIAGGNTAAVFERVEGAFNPVAELVERGFIGAGGQAPGPGRNDWCSPLVFNAFKDLLTIIGFVGNAGAGAEAGE